MDKLLFVMLVGPSGCGKTTWAKNYAHNHYNSNWEVLSSDDIREELWGDANDQQNPEKVFEELNCRVRKNLEEGYNIIYDATNLSRKRRVGYLRNLKQWANAHSIELLCIAMVVVARESECICRNYHRERKVPVNVIQRHFKQIQLPWYDEGWDTVDFTITSLYQNYGQNWGELLHRLDIPHDNIHHKYDILEHSLRVAARLGEPFSDGWKLGVLHDCGKCDTKGWVKPNGEEDGQAHYYNHHLIGGYKSLLMKDKNEIAQDIYRRAMAIQYHMEPWFRSEENLEEFYARLDDEKLVDMIKRLHEADKEEA